ncbi:hypothetical protein WS62_13575 [Burkholderia sp. ABCPW 14]|nr:hypothetical protein WS62_13575 [Burkholderia sp. ABCPW 14]
MYRIKRLRKKPGLHCKRKRRFKATANSKHDRCYCAESVKPRFFSGGAQSSAAAPNQAWCGDITYIAIDESRLYPAGLKDLYSGEIVGYAMGEPMTKYPVMQACFAPSQLGDRRRA